MVITKDMTIGDIVYLNEHMAPALMRVGIHCLGCPASQAETIEEACMVHGIDCDALVEQLNELAALSV